MEIRDLASQRRMKLAVKKKGALQLKGSLLFKLPFFLYFRILRDSAGSDNQDDDGDDEDCTDCDDSPEEVARDCGS
jgi:hypothetical protein